MISVQIIGTEKVVGKMKRLTDTARIRLLTEVNAIAAKLVRGVKESKLTGQVLHVRTGRLRRSIHQTVRSSNTEVTGIVGTNVVYAHAHEYGFEGDESVRGHLRRAKSGKKFPVRPFTRHVNLPARSFLRSALQDMKAEIRQRLTAAMRDIEGGSH